MDTISAHLGISCRMRDRSAEAAHPRSFPIWDGSRSAPWQQSSAAHLPRESPARHTSRDHARPLHNKLFCPARSGIPARYANIALSFLLKKSTAGKDDMKQKALMRHRAETGPGFAGHIAAASEQNIHPSRLLIAPAISPCARQTPALALDRAQHNALHEEALHKRIQAQHGEGRVTISAYLMVSVSSSAVAVSSPPPPCSAKSLPEK